MLKPLGLAAFTLLMATRTASALPEFFETVITGPFPIGTTWGSGFSVPLTLPGFDPDWGTLRSVWLYTAVQLDGDILFTNPTIDYPAAAHARLRYVAVVTSPSGTWSQHVYDSFEVHGDIIEPGESQLVHFRYEAWHD